MRLEGKVCVITGAGGGMGREAAMLFTEEGAKVCAADVNLAAAQETVTGCSGDAFALQVDVADEASVKAMMDATEDAASRRRSRVRGALTVAAEGTQASVDRNTFLTSE